MDIVVAAEPPPPFCDDAPVAELQRAREAAGEAMRAGREAWERMVRERDPVTLTDKQVHRPINRAYFKMRELGVHVPPPQAVLCLAEAPGGFAQACEHMWPRARCAAVSLGGEAAIPFSDALRKCQILRDAPNTGDLTALECIRWLAQRTANRYDLVTADGGVEVDDHTVLEQCHTCLALAQACCAIAANRTGGSFVLKIFEGCTAPTLDLCRLLRMLYASVTVEKPRTSKACNSERYVICVNFRPTEPLRSQIVTALERATQQTRHGTLFGQRLLAAPPTEATRALFRGLAERQAESIRASLRGDARELRALRATDCRELARVCGLRFVSGALATGPGRLAKAVRRLNHEDEKEEDAHGTRKA